MTSHQVNGSKQGRNSTSDTWLPSRTARARKNDGSYVGEAPASRDSQWGRKITGSIPETNFGMREDKTAELVTSAHAAAAIGKPIEDVQQRGASMFDAVWVDERVVAESRRASAAREKERIEAARAVMMQELEPTPRMINTREGKLSAPSGWGFLGFLAVGCALSTVLACEWVSAATLRKFELQSLATALLLTSPFISFALATKLLFRRDPSRAMRVIQVAFHCFGVVSFATWLVLLSANYGTALREDFELPSKTATVVFTVVQFLAALAGSSWLTMLLGSLFTPLTSVKPNADWERMAKELQRLDHEINRWTLVIGREDAELAAYAASRDAWIAIGRDAYERSRHRLALIEERMRLIGSN
ncbi:MAG TPA: hypothetical protein PLX89_04785 [Verrucomicrobiota bacterium]|nr:hypothetical protein [Verrucomicrobiales bacterium]HRI12302.1 hypothetical protein [Verrucomicrobiota bacterium]